MGLKPVSQSNMTPPAADSTTVAGLVATVSTAPSAVKDLDVAAPDARSQAAVEAATVVVAQSKLSESGIMAGFEGGSALAVKDATTKQAEATSNSKQPAVPVGVLEAFVTAPIAKKAAAAAVASFMGPAASSPLTTATTLRSMGITDVKLLDLIKTGKGWATFHYELGREFPRLLLMLPMADGTYIWLQAHYGDSPLVNSIIAGASGGFVSGLPTAAIDNPKTARINGSLKSVRDITAELITRGYPARVAFSMAFGGCWYSVLTNSAKIAYPDGLPKQPSPSTFLVLTTLSSLAGVAGSAVGYPALLIANMQTKGKKSALEVIKDIYGKCGLRGFYAGLRFQLIKSAVHSAFVGAGLVAGGMIYEKACKEWFDCNKHHLRTLARGHDVDAESANRILAHFIDEGGINDDPTLAKEVEENMQRLNLKRHDIENSSNFMGHAQLPGFTGGGDALPAVLEESAPASKQGLTVGGNIRFSSPIDDQDMSHLPEPAMDSKPAVRSTIGDNIGFSSPFDDQDMSPLPEPVADSKPAVKSKKMPAQYNVYAAALAHKLYQPVGPLAMAQQRLQPSMGDRLLAPRQSPAYRMPPVWMNHSSRYMAQTFDRANSLPPMHPISTAREKAEAIQRSVTMPVPAMPAASAAPERFISEFGSSG